VPGCASSPWRASAAITSGVSSATRTAAAIRAITAGGVPRGASRP
jgi:hypothetical protein